MWDLRVANPFGRLSIRNTLMFVAATVATSLALALLAAPTTHAADATWQGDSIVYNDKQYEKAPDAKEGDGLGLPDGSKVYRYVAPRNEDQPNATQKAYVIYFGPNDDPTKLTTAKFAVYDFTPPDTYSNATDQRSVSIEKKSGGDQGKACTIDGIGWFICPISSFLASTMDWLFKNVLAQFLAVRPVQTSTNNPLYNAWSIMRSIANVAFVAAFLVIIYSQVTSMGISNYGIKRLLPRLVVAAVLVNISYWICALAIDASNILGFSINDLLMNITRAIHNGGGSTDVVSWESVTAAILSGGTLATAGALSVIAAGGISGSIAMLLPVLVGVLLAALVAILIMAARQAIIIILVIIAPLAFVAYLLPNTEKYFEKWKDLMITMLMLFPVFSVIFGGSQLAGTAIIQNANSIIMLILGMAVQVAPLVILPFMIKFSGSLLGRIAGITNDRTKGLMDESRNYAKSIADSKRAEALARPNATWKKNALTRAIQAKENGRRDREAKQKNNEMLADARWEARGKTAGIHEGAARAEMIKNMATHNAEAHVEHMKKTDADMRKLNQDSQAAATRAEMLKNIASTDAEGHAAHLKRTNAAMQELDLQARAGKLTLDTTNTKLETTWEQFKAGDTTGMVAPDNLSASGLAAFVRSRENFANETQATSQEAMLTSMRQDMAKRKQSANLSESMLKDRTSTIEGQSILDYAGGIMQSAGADSALSKAITIERKEFQENVENNLQLMKHFDVSNPAKSELTMGENVTVEKNGVTYTFRSDNPHVHEAAIADVMKSGSYNEIEKLLLSTGEGGINHPYAGTVSRDIKSTGVDKKALYFGSKIINDIGQGKISGEEGRTKAIVFHLAEGKVKADALAAMDAGALQHMFDVVTDPKRSQEAAQFVKPEDRASYEKNIRAFRDTVEQVVKTPLINQNSSKQALENMENFLAQTRNMGGSGS